MISNTECYTNHSKFYTRTFLVFSPHLPPVLPALSAYVMSEAQQTFLTIRKQVLYERGISESSLC